MKPILALLDKLPFYPLLLGIYPILFLWVTNFIQIQSFVVLRSLIISISIAGFVYLACLILFRNQLKSGLLAGLFLAIFFFYGQAYDLLEEVNIFGFLVGRHRYTLPFFLAAFGIGAWWILRTRRDLRNLTKALNIIGGLLTAITVVQLGYLIFTNLPATHVRSQAEATPTKAVAEIRTSESNTPDVYYIVVDGYDREDLLKQSALLDNHKFITELEKLGFVIPKCTQSNYSTTITSMASSLNMDYVDKLGVTYLQLAKEKRTFWPQFLKSQLFDNRVMQQFREMGYKIITYRTIFTFLNFPTSDILYDYKKSIGLFQGVETLNFQSLFLRTTLLRPLIEASEHSPNQFRKLPAGLLQFINPDLIRKSNNPNYQTYLQYQYQLDKLENISQIPGKKFLYAHLMVTHPPFVFTPSGDFRPDTNYDDKAYPEQITYVNQRLLTFIQNVLSQSQTKPVIILQGDHAYGWEKRGKEVFDVLNAYYLPQGGGDKIYPEITPVNTFRLILSTYFNKNYPLLPDQSIWIDAELPGGYEVVPPTCINQ